MPTQINVFITGATGYLGGSVLARLLKHPQASTFKITALVRSADKAEKLKTLGVESILGSYSDKDLSFLTDAAAQADVVFELANCDHLEGNLAILEGIKKRHAKTGKAPILIHASGTAIIMDDARGLHGDSIVYSDLDSEKLNALPAEALHRNVDIPLIEADKNGQVKTYLITPGTLFGVPSGPLVELGVQNTNSIQIPYFAKFALAYKQGLYIGKGLNVWCAADVDETADLFVLVFNSVLKDPESIGHGVDGYYFAESTTYSAIEVARIIQDTFVELGFGDKKEARPFTLEELEATLGPMWPLFATNSKGKGDRSRALGWNPKASKEDFVAYVKGVTKKALASGN
ncbi:NAD(P)-binding protein [Agrocybe pediades]|nr:NAD(P)-binding protein [Agrocybe pediades]